MKKPQIVILLALFVLGFIVRLYRVDNPIADWHSFRQADTSSVSRNFVKHGYNFLYPTYDDISNIASGKDNPMGYRYVEFPIYNFFQASFYQLIDGFNLEIWGRLTTIFTSLLSLLFIFLLTRKYSNSTIALFASFFYAFLPYSIYYSRVILPDPMMVTASLGSVYFFDLWTDNWKSETGKWKFNRNSQLSTINPDIFGINYQCLLAIVFTTAAFLLKPYALFFTLPLLYLAWKKFRFGILKQWQLYLFAVITLLPLILWRIWMQHHPEGIPASDWLFNGNGIRFRPAFFRWIGYERITKLILGYIGIIPFGVGVIGVISNFKFKILNLKKIDCGFFLSFLVSSTLYVCTIATGNVQHDYYQILIIPTLSMFCGIGVYSGYHLMVGRIGKIVSVLVLVLIISSSFYFSWNIVKDYFNINNRDMIVAGKKADMILPQNARVIAALPEPQVGDTSFLYYVNRPGWPAFEKGIEELIQMGATHIVMVNPTKNDFEGFGKTYKILASGKEYLILELK